MYKPYWLAITPLLQSVILVLSELLVQKFYKEKYDREVIKAEDGGTLGVDWAYCKDTRVGRPSVSDGQKKSKPILLLAPGMGGGSYNLYTLCLMWIARK